MFSLNLIYCFKILSVVLGGHANNKLDLGSKGILKFLATKASLGAFVMVRITTGHLAKANSSLEWATWKPGLRSWKDTALQSLCSVKPSQAPLPASNTPWRCGWVPARAWAPGAMETS